MDQKTENSGLLYERLMMRAYRLSRPAPGLQADRRIYYLLFFIKNGVDLRGTGYHQHFIVIKENVGLALQQLLRQELHDHEIGGLKSCIEDVEIVWNEESLVRTIRKALSVTGRLASDHRH